MGSDLRTATEDVPAEYKVVYRLEKDGLIEEFTDETYPDSTWKYLGSRTDVVKEGRMAQISDFSFLDGGEYDYATDILSDSGYLFILVMHSIESADESRVDKINELYDFCEENGLPFYAATSSDEAEMQLWRKRTGAEYPILWADDIMLKTMVRANPGVVMLKDGKVVGKWNVEYMPQIEDYTPDTVLQELSGKQSGVCSWQSWLFVLSLSVLFFVVFDLLAGDKKKKTVKTDENSEIIK